MNKVIFVLLKKKKKKIKKIIIIIIIIIITIIIMIAWACMAGFSLARSKSPSRRFPFERLAG